MELALRPVPLFHLEPLAGIQPQAESNPHCPGRERAVLVRWRFLPAVALIVSGVSSRNGLRRTRDRGRYPGGHRRYPTKFSP